ncbi:hypothetical protein [Staphylococcus saprophyticus]|uniref:hypothetical protein n=1 Tax=Staphylococcus saprophyticus TaxID=29385 RepID=UPI003905E81F
MKSFIVGANGDVTSSTMTEFETLLLMPFFSAIAVKIVPAFNGFFKLIILVVCPLFNIV